jgi:hypothetical protein
MTLSIRFGRKKLYPPSRAKMTVASGGKVSVSDQCSP